MLYTHDDDTGLVVGPLQLLVVQHETCKLAPPDLNAPAEHAAAHEADTAR